MSMEFKPDAFKDFPDWKTSNNQDGLLGQLKGKIFDEPVLPDSKLEGDLFKDAELKLKDVPTAEPSSTSDLFTTEMELDATKHLEGQEALDWLKENHPNVYDNINGTFDDGRCFQNRDYWKDKLVCEEKKDGSLEIYMDDPSAENSRITIKGDLVCGDSGCSKGKFSQAPNMFLDDPMPNKAYNVDRTTTFETDGLGRTVLAEQDRTNPVGDNGKKQLDKDRRILVDKFKDGLDSSKEDAGHILQKNQGGIDEVINLVPMDKEWQRSGGEWRNLESREESVIKDAQDNGAKEITSRREIIYDGDSKRPSKIKFETIVDGEVKISEVVDCPKAK